MAADTCVVGAPEQKEEKEEEEERSSTSYFVVIVIVILTVPGLFVRGVPSSLSFPGASPLLLLCLIVWGQRVF